MTRLGQRGRAAGLVSAALVSLTACAGLPHRDFTQAEQAGATIEGISDARFWADQPPPATTNPSVAAGAPLTVLALSGGGDDGAYGAGFLAGWSSSGGRPQFTVVTGVSIGALIAPFAFLGSRYDPSLAQAMTASGPHAIYRPRFFLAIPFSTSLVSTEPLRRLLARYVTDAMIDEIGVEQARGRRLFVGTANFDAARGVVWNMGAIAASDAPGRHDLFRKVLLASAAVPGLFPPVLIDARSGGHPLRELHADGSTIAGILAVPPGAATMGGPPIEGAGALHYLIVNDTLGGDFKVTNGALPRIISRAVSVTAAAALRDEATSTWLWTQRTGIGYRLTYIDADFDMGAPHRYLDPDFVRRLYGYGVQRGRAAAWLTRPPTGDPVKGGVDSPP